MLSLAPVKYANCFVSHGGPLDSLEESTIQFGDTQWSVANARLRHGLCPEGKDTVLFAAMDGTGLDRNPLVARHKAISEALERWAHAVVSRGADRERYGFDADSTSNGMAAFPGCLPRQARSFALREAIERFSMVAWWCGLLPIEVRTGATASGVGTVEHFCIRHPFPHHQVALVRRESKQGFMAYGFACAKRWNLAIEAATLEMERCDILLERYYQRNRGLEVGDISTIADFMEQRILFFSMPEGVESFDRKVTESRNLTMTLQRPTARFDGEIKGPWSRFATVWRVTFPMPSQGFLKLDPGFFFW